jgi:hypothetical protein
MVIYLRGKDTVRTLTVPAQALAPSALAYFPAVPVDHSAVPDAL